MLRIDSTPSQDAAVGAHDRHRTSRGRAAVWQAGSLVLGHRGARLNLIVLSVVAAMAVLGPLLSQFDVQSPDWSHILSPPSLTTGHIFGTDANGRDLFVRTMYGARVSLTVGLAATAISLVIGVLYGTIAGFFGGWVDNLMMRGVDLLYSLPFIFIMILLVTVFGRNMVLIFVSIGLVEWLTMARIVRGQTLVIRRTAYVEAAQVTGVGSVTIIRRHVIPNLIGTVIVYATITVPTAILTETFLSFLGLGVQEPLASWGSLIAQGTPQIETAAWTLLFPAGFMLTTLFCLNSLGDSLRDALDPKL